MTTSQKGRILIVDDEAGIRAVFREFLSDEGYETSEAPDGQVALGMLEEDPVDLAIIDIFMPEMDGIQLLSELRARAITTPVIAVSGGGEREYPELPLRLARLLGARATLEKPVDLDDLLVQIERCLDLGPR